MDQILTSAPPKVLAVIVTFHPDLSRFSKLISAIDGQVELPIVVDNGSLSEVRTEIEAIIGGNGHFISLGENTGIAAAQNAGIAYALQHAADFVLLLDQDSLPSPDMVHGLVSHTLALTQAGIAVAAVGPRLLDGRWKNEERHRPEGNSVGPLGSLEVDHVIASGALIPSRAIETVGNMREELFIDFVDIEWCLRAARQGYRSFIASEVVMDHQLGQLMTVMGRTISTHSPIRHYFMARNTVWLMKQRWLPARWRYLTIPKVVLHLIVNGVFAKPHQDHLRMMARGVRDGYLDRLGRGPIKS